MCCVSAPRRFAWSRACSSSASDVEKRGLTSSIAVVEMTSTRGGAPAGLGWTSSKCDGLCLTSFRGITGGVWT